MNILVLSGAGLSQPSGIQTFRGNGGLWNGFSVNEVATNTALQTNSDIVNSFFHNLWVNMKDKVPNAAHHAIAELELDHNVLVLTQNIDDLHERSGSTEVIHLHGRISRVDSSDGYIDRYDNMPLVGTRPDVVLFGEELPSLEYAIHRVDDFEPDEVWIVGTSMEVHPFASIPAMIQKSYKSKKKPIKFVIFDINPKTVKYNAKITDYSPRERIVLVEGSIEYTLPLYVS